MYYVRESKHSLNFIYENLFYNSLILKVKIGRMANPSGYVSEIFIIKSKALSEILDKNKFVIIKE